MDIIIIAVIGFVIVIAGVVIAPTVKLAMDVAPHLYTNTRCSARAGLILGRKEYETMTGSTSMKEVFATLEETSYSAVAEHSHSIAEASLLLEQELHDTYAWLVTVVPEKLQPVVEAMLGRFEVAQLKEALNRLQRGEGVGELPYVRDEQLRLKLESATDYTSFSDALIGSPYEPVFAQRSLQELEPLTTALDAHALTSVRAAMEACKDQKAAQPFIDYWKRVIDLGNLRLAQRRIAGADVQFVPGGHLTPASLEEVGDANQLAELLEKGPYAGLGDLEDGLQRMLKREAGLVNAKYPLKGGSIVRFIIDKELEVRNLNVLLKLKSEGFAADAIQERLIV